MISIRKYLDGPRAAVDADASHPQPAHKTGDPLSLCLEAYRAGLHGMGLASVEACPALGTALDDALAKIAESLRASPSPETVAAADASVRSEVQNWGRSTARHYQQKAAEVKEILLVMARTAESVGERDQRCARQLNEVTANLKTIASLDDISQIRTSIEKSAADLKGSVDRMTAEGKAVLDRLQMQVATFETKLAEAEQIASCDALTRLRSRSWMESQIEERIAAAKPFCVALLDLDGFKGVNDVYGHLAGDDVLKQFAAELKSACRSTDLVGRWGGDEFLVLIDCQIARAQPQMERVRKWVCGSYTVGQSAGPRKLPVHASIGLAEFAAPESMKQLLDRADAAMYRQKAESRPIEVARRR
jgi:diguanylate cyclase (GGDEF)-like protein